MTCQPGKFTHLLAGEVEVFVIVEVLTVNPCKSSKYALHSGHKGFFTSTAHTSITCPINIHMLRLTVL